MEESTSMIHKIVKQINTDLPLHSMWDGFWINSFKRRVLIITCAFDNWTGRNYDIIFKQVTFYNVPERWRDTDICSNDLLRVATAEEFHKQNPDFDIKDNIVFAIDINWYVSHDTITQTEGGTRPTTERIRETHPFYIVARHVYLILLTPGAVDWSEDYADPVPNAIFPCFTNRVQKKVSNA